MQEKLNLRQSVIKQFS